MYGLMLSERYFKLFGIPLIEQKFPEFKSRIAAGLVGEGSDCFGFDDYISRDHDWGPGFCLWLNQMDYENIGDELQHEYDKLPQNFAGFAIRTETAESPGRVGVFEIGKFYEKFIGKNHPPSTWKEWIRIPETHLAVCTNGKIFQDDLGDFTFFRNKLLRFYPEEVRLKLIVSRCITIGREGQYNASRLLERKEFVAANYALSIFIRAAISLTFLLNYKYRPFYKWMHKSVKSLPILGSEIFSELERLVLFQNINFVGHIIEKQKSTIDNICWLLLGELKRQELSKSKSTFLTEHSKIIEDKIIEPDLRDYKIADTLLY